MRPADYVGQPIFVTAVWKYSTVAARLNSDGVWHHKLCHGVCGKLLKWIERHWSHTSHPKIV